VLPTVEVRTGVPLQVNVPLLTVAVVGVLVHPYPGVTTVIAPGTLLVTAMVPVAPTQPPPVKARLHVPVPVAEIPEV